VATYPRVLFLTTNLITPVAQRFPGLSLTKAASALRGYATYAHPRSRFLTLLAACFKAPADFGAGRIDPAELVFFQEGAAFEEGQGM
jgi:hypothetical protein